MCDLLENESTDFDLCWFLDYFSFVHSPAYAVSSVCPLDKFLCLSGECIDKNFVCNTYVDCRDGSDETLDACG